MRGKSVANALTLDDVAAVFNSMVPMVTHATGNPPTFDTADPRLGALVHMLEGKVVIECIDSWLFEDLFPAMLKSAASSMRLPVLMNICELALQTFAIDEHSDPPSTS